MREEVLLGEYKEVYKGELYSQKLSGLAIYTMNKYSMSLAIIDVNSFDEFDLENQMAYKSYNILNSIFKMTGVDTTYWGIIKTGDETYSLDLAEMLRKSTDFISFFTRNRNVVKLPDLYSETLTMNLNKQNIVSDNDRYELEKIKNKEKVKKL